MENLNKPNEGQCMLNSHAGRPTSGFGAENLQATLNGPPSFGVKLPRMMSSNVHCHNQKCT
ncbi:hypothetical protein GBA52_015128 [Prunus armeniaca]|nr:hypothetical protein GBA52_015128 [Prunus armeniaca]